MSLILKEIDMPKGTDGLSITFHSQDGVTETHILDATQAIQIPKGHGDIKDISRLWPTRINKLEYGGSDGREVYYRSIEVYRKKDIDNAPTILEAEE